MKKDEVNLIQVQELTVNGGQSKWAPVTKEAPCSNCGKEKWCSRTADGQAEICRTKEIPGGKECTDRNGEQYWLKRKIVKLELTGECASDENCAAVYEYLNTITVLDDVHRDFLVGKGLSEQGIRERGYKTLSQSRRSELFKSMQNKFGLDLLKTIPGFILKQSKWNLGGASGILIPIRNIDGQIIRYLIRPDKIVGKNKYNCLSSKKHGGAGSGIMVHVPVFDGPRDVVRITEGVLKADTATVRGEILTIGIPGASNWRMAEATIRELNPKKVIVSLDADAAENEDVATAVQGLFTMFVDRGFVVEYEHWDLAQAKGIDDALINNVATSRLSGEEALNVIKALPSLQENENKKAHESLESTLPAIKYGLEQMSKLIEATWEVILKDNEKALKLYSSNSKIVRLKSDEHRLYLEEYTQVDMLGYLYRIADWFEEGESSIKEEKVRWEKVGRPPKDLANDLMSYVNEGLPVLNRIIKTPIFGTDKKLIDEPGYNSVSQVFYDDRFMVKIEAIPEEITVADLKAAVELLVGILCDFPLANRKADSSRLIAVLVTYAMREFIDGPTPLTLIDATLPGSGKGLLVEVLGIILEGQVVASSVLPKNDDEIRKKITAELLHRPTMILLDNADQEDVKVHSPSLASVLTSRFWTDRFLSKSMMVTSPNFAVWIMTGNNVKLSTEIARRTTIIKLQPDESKPWERDVSKFKYPDLKGWVVDNRASLLRAIYIMCQSWLNAGAVASSKNLGSFEAWSRVVGGVLEHAGLSEFLDRDGSAYEAADAETDEWLGFVQAWREKHNFDLVKASDLHALCKEHDLLSTVIGSGSDRSIQTKLGLALPTQVGRIYGCVKIVKGKDAGKHGKWYKLESLLKNVPQDTEEGPQSNSSEKSDSKENNGDVDNDENLKDAINANIKLQDIPSANGDIKVSNATLASSQRSPESVGWYDAI